MQKANSRKNLWESAPSSVKSAVGVVLGRVPVPYLLGARFRKHLEFARASQGWPAERARTYQTRELRRMCSLAQAKSAYWRRVFDESGFKPGDLGSPEDLAALPTMDKNTVRANLEEMCAVAPNSPGVDIVSTGGSTGEPLRFYIGADRSAPEYAYLVASWERCGYDANMTQVVIRGQVVPEDRNGLRHSYDPVLRRHYYSNFHMSEENMGRYVEHMATVGPCYLHAYPSSSSSLARFIERNNLAAPRNIRGVLAGSEMVYPEDRAVVERVFGVRFFSWYGHSEKLVLASECEHGSLYHVWPTYGFFELLDKEGRRVTTPGEVGEIVGTSFINDVQPFIRYRTGDFGRYEGERCTDCGREHPILSEIEGRWPQGGLIAGDGSTISMTAFNVHDDTFDGVAGYQFLQSERGRAVLRVVAIDGLSEAQRSRVMQKATDRLQRQVELTLEVRPELQRTLSGKHMRVILDVPSDGGGH